MTSFCIFSIVILKFFFPESGDWGSQYWTRHTLEEISVERTRCVCVAYKRPLLLYQVTDVLKSQDLKMGYNDLLVIPAGATNIRVAEVYSNKSFSVTILVTFGKNSNFL